jgi:hypothetical protein
MLSALLHAQQQRNAVWLYLLASASHVSFSIDAQGQDFVYPPYALKESVMKPERVI